MTTCPSTEKSGSSRTLSTERLWPFGHIARDGRTVDAFHGTSSGMRSTRLLAGLGSFVTLISIALSRWVLSGKTMVSSLSTTGRLTSRKIRRQLNVNSVGATVTRNAVNRYVLRYVTVPRAHPRVRVTERNVFSNLKDLPLTLAPLMVRARGELL